jgi:hypothetical protein
MEISNIHCIFFSEALIIVQERRELISRGSRLSGLDKKEKKDYEHFFYFLEYYYFLLLS